MLTTNNASHTFPDDPMRVAPPHCAPGEIEPPEPRQPSAEQLRALTREAENDLMACLKGKRDFLAYEPDGTLQRLDGYELWAVLTDDMKTSEIAATLGAVLACADTDFLWNLRRTLWRYIADPFVAEQVKWRVEFASEEAMEQWG